ncbi:hypothetical protein C8D90_11158 [Enterobacillus tribolii]|uniref:Uncharacterized protein n=1 Tax=Enterobacillus tribolii TaxID=1487935 RepID=A0A370QE81_9GAMM|nr:hypothetical protein C8D90_11158 [Enterobacillus tribolii]
MSGVDLSLRKAAMVAYVRFNSDFYCLILMSCIRYLIISDLIFNLLKIMKMNKLYYSGVQNDLLHQSRIDIVLVLSAV